jgi:hypothetical protein
LRRRKNLHCRFFEAFTRCPLTPTLSPDEEPSEEREPTVPTKSWVGKPCGAAALSLSPKLVWGRGLGEGAAFQVEEGFDFCDVERICIADASRHSRAAPSPQPSPPTKSRRGRGSQPFRRRACRRRGSQSFRRRACQSFFRALRSFPPSAHFLHGVMLTIPSRMELDRQSCRTRARCKGPRSSVCVQALVSGEPASSL